MNIDAREIERRVSKVERGPKPDVVTKTRSRLSGVVPTLISIIIGLVVAVNLMPTLFKAVEEAEEKFPKGSAEAGILGVLPILFIVMVILGAIAYMGNFGSREEEVQGEEKELSETDEIRRLQRVKRKHLIYLG